MDEMPVVVPTDADRHEKGRPIKRIEQPEIRITGVGSEADRRTTAVIIIGKHDHAARDKGKA